MLSTFSIITGRFHGKHSSGLLSAYGPNCAPHSLSKVRSRFESLEVSREPSIVLRYTELDAAAAKYGRTDAPSNAPRRRASCFTWNVRRQRSQVECASLGVRFTATRQESPPTLYGSTWNTGDNSRVMRRGATWWSGIFAELRRAVRVSRATPTLSRRCSEPTLPKLDPRAVHVKRQSTAQHDRGG